ncbi:MAG: nucleoside-triphosphatase [Clostridia bacterium]
MHLFLEGPAKTGKSTLIREEIAPYVDRIRGFSSQRLWMDGRPCGYRLTPASQLQLDAEYFPQMSGVFTWHNGEESRKNPEVFEQLGVSLLEETSGAPLILLDEIGGSELLVPLFRKRLYEVLSAPIPCIGVLKLSSKAGFMIQAAGYPKEIVALNKHLRDWLLQSGRARILSFSSQNREVIRKEIKQFLKEVFHDVGTV